MSWKRIFERSKAFEASDRSIAASIFTMVGRFDSGAACREKGDPGNLK
jgi:hypothetical protein